MSLRILERISPIGFWVSTALGRSAGRRNNNSFPLLEILRKGIIGIILGSLQQQIIILRSIAVGSIQWTLIRISGCSGLSEYDPPKDNRPSPFRPYFAVGGQNTQFQTFIRRKAYLRSGHSSFVQSMLFLLVHVCFF